MYKHQLKIENNNKVKGTWFRVKMYVLCMNRILTGVMMHVVDARKGKHSQKLCFNTPYEHSQRRGYPTLWQNRLQIIYIISYGLIFGLS